MSEITKEEIMDALKKIAESSVKETTPEFHIGDTVKVSVNIREGERERIQMFEGTVIVVDVKVIRRGKVRRSKLYYLRDRVGKAAKVKEEIRK